MTVSTPSSEKNQLQAHFNKLATASQDEDGPGSPNMISESLIDAESDDEETGGPAGRPLSSGTSSSAAEGSAANHHLPPYSGPASRAHEAALEQQDSGRTAASAQKRGPTRYPGLPHVDYRLYQPPLFELSADKTAIRTTAPYLSATASALAALVRSQATVPPKPVVEIKGLRSSKSHKPDFHVKLNLMPLIVSEDPRRRMNYVRCVGRGELALRGGNGNKPSMEPHIDADAGGAAGGGGGGGGGPGGAIIDAWCRRFVDDPASVKVFVLERQVANMDIGWLEGQIRSLVAATGYAGQVTVSFPILHARVVVQNPDRVNRFFTKVTTLFTGKSTYEVVKAVWPFATHKNDGEPGRKFAVQSEETWWREWRDPIRHAITTRRTGWVTNEDKLEWLMEGVGTKIGKVDWGPDY